MLKTNKITKKDFYKLDEKDVMFITNPGRMGDEDGSTFIVKNDNVFTVYRLSGWMYPEDGEVITKEEAAKQFPEWMKAWKHSNDEDYSKKYKHLYMGFGNGLNIDKSIFSEYEPYLNKLVDDYLKDKDDREGLNYSAIYSEWQEAFINMANDKNYIIK